MTTLYLLGMFALAFLGIFVWTRRAPAWRVAFVAAFVSLCAFPVAAQTADGSVLETIRPMLLEIISLIIVAVVAWVGKTAKKKWGIDIEARHREALHWALYTGAQLALKQQLTGAMRPWADHCAMRADFSSTSARSSPPRIGARRGAPCRISLAKSRLSCG